MFSQQSYFKFLTVVVISLGYTSRPTTGVTCTAGAGCLACNASNSADCTACSSGLGLSNTAAPHSCQACNTNPTCINCTTMKLCTKCTDLTYVPYKNGTAACGPCAGNCSSCTTNGAGKCDTCITGYSLNNSTQQCDHNSTTIPKNGDCPYVNKTLFPTCTCVPPDQQNLCQVDNQCNGTDKCCFVNSRGMQCVPPAPVFVKPGCCPAQMPVACVVPTPENQANDCNSDGTCPSNQKCCKSFCFGNRCMNPA